MKQNYFAADDMYMLRPAVD